MIRYILAIPAPIVGCFALFPIASHLVIALQVLITQPTWLRYLVYINRHPLVSVNETRTLLRPIELQFPLIKVTRRSPETMRAQHTVGVNHALKQHRMTNIVDVVPP